MSFLAVELFDAVKTEVMDHNLVVDITGRLLYRASSNSVRISGSRPFRLLDLTKQAGRRCAKKEQIRQMGAYSCKAKGNGRAHNQFVPPIGVTVYSEGSNRSLASLREISVE